MGHVRLGRLPKTWRWRGVLGLLRQAPDDVPAVAEATARATESRLSLLGDDPTLSYCFWLLTRVAAASRGAEFADELTALGLAPADEQSALLLICQLSDHVRAEVQQHPESGAFGELASLAFRRALTETVGQESQGLFGSTVAHLRAAFRRYSSPSQFGALAKRFFGDFFARTLTHFVEKELANSVGPEQRLTTVVAGQEFGEALDTYARQSAVIMEQFAADWYSKRNWESQGAISRAEAQGFVAIAVRKLRSELVRSELVP